ncbi:MAG TPA: hypothetical protein VH643_21285 [Gemmataceae bacterium]|jgi:hypothetical protein
MMFLNSLTSWLRKRTPAVKTPKPPSTRLQLEELEDRIVPTFDVATYVNPTVQITPGFTVTERVTATVTTFPGLVGNMPFLQPPGLPNGTITPIPAGAFNPTSGNVLFILNNQVQSATLNANSQATATFQVPLLAFLAGQELDVYYNGSADLANQNFWEPFTFRAPLYLNFDNLLLPGTLTFAQLTAQQQYTFEINSFQNPNLNRQGDLPPSAFPTTLRPFNNVNGETDSLGLFAFNYGTQGAINTVNVLGFQLPGSFALQLGAFNGLTSSSSSSSG